MSLEKKEAESLQHTYDDKCRPKISCLLLIPLLDFGLNRVKRGEEHQQVAQSHVASQS